MSLCVVRVPAREVWLCGILAMQPRSFRLGLQVSVRVGVGVVARAVPNSHQIQQEQQFLVQILLQSSAHSLRSLSKKVLPMLHIRYTVGLTVCTPNAQVVKVCKPFKRSQGLILTLTQFSILALTLPYDQAVPLLPPPSFPFTLHPFNAVTVQATV